MSVYPISNTICNEDCIIGMKKMPNNSVDFTLTDIPYGAVNRSSNGLRNLDKEFADEITFELKDFLDEVYRVSKNSICIFCGKEQFSEIFAYFASKKRNDQSNCLGKDKSFTNEWSVCL